MEGFAKNKTPFLRSEAELEAAEAQLEVALAAQQQATERYEEAEMTKILIFFR